MSNKHGDFIWYELMTGDARAAQDFYGPLIGWRFGGEDHYRHIEASDGGMIGGVLQLTPEMTSGGAVPAWIGYILVDDVDAAIASMTADGGSVHMPARDMENVGRLAMVADPQGVPFYVMKPSPPPGRENGNSNAFAEHAPMDGHCAWNELVTTDQDAAKAFYGKQFGWKVGGEMDMGPMGKYEFLHYGKEGGGVLGAVMTMTKEQPSPSWNFYFRVPDIDRAVKQLTENGGRMIVGPQEIPGGDFVLNAFDPQGAAFALIGKRA